jgi:hypothetical protein
MKKTYLLKLLQLKNYVVMTLFLLTLTSLRAQTAFTPGGSWDYGYYSSGTAGTVVHNNGVVQLLSSTAGASAASVHETTPANQIITGTSWSRCYNVFFGCPGSDNIAGPDTKGDGLAWSLYNPLFSSCEPTGGYRLGSIGGGMGYANTGCSKIITLEFDTYSSQNTNGYDANYGGTGTPSTGSQDEISLHIDGHADNTGVLYSSNPGNLEDGFQHAICISYTPNATLGNGGVMQVTIDGTLRFSYEMGATYNLEKYLDPYPPCGCTGVPPYTSNSTFDASSLNQMWSSGKDGAANSSIVAPAGVSIVPNLIGGAGTLGCFPALPVEMMRFTAVNKNETVVLDWSTASEKNNNKFVIERSSDGINWVSIGEVMGAGNTNSATDYTFTDVDPLNGTSYYRLRQIDADGQSSLSKILSVFTSNPLISVSPNPFDDVLTIVTTSKGEVNVAIHDIQGRLLYEISKEVSDGLLTIYPELASGAYIVKVSVGEFVEHYRVIKK